MAELIDTLQTIMSNSMKNAGLTDIAIGTVTNANPLEVTLMSTMLPLPREVLILTDNVIEKKITKLGHKHESYQGICSTELADIKCYVNGKPLPSNDEYIILKESLAKGDKVIMLRVLGGQNFIVLSKAF